MSNVAIFNPGQLPAFARKGELSPIAKAMMGGSGGQSGKRISIKGGVFRLIADGKEVASVEERHLDVVIVNAAEKVSRTYYAGTYVEGESKPPTCWSQDGNVPDAAVKAPQCANCAACPQNVKGSGQGDSRACRFSQRLAVVLANDVEGDVMQLALAATSIFGRADGENRPLQAYAQWLGTQGVDPTLVVTRMKFDTKAPVPKLFFKAARWLTEDEYDICKEKGKSPDALKAIAMTVSQTDGVAPAAPLAIPGTPPKAKPAPVVEEEEDEAPPPPPKAKAKAKPAPVVEEVEEVEEPVVKTPAPKASSAVPAAAGIAKTLAEWDDE